MIEEADEKETVKEEWANLNNDKITEQLEKEVIPNVETVTIEEVFQELRDVLILAKPQFHVEVEKRDDTPKEKAGEGEIINETFVFTADCQVPLPVSIYASREESTKEEIHQEMLLVAEQTVDIVETTYAEWNEVTGSLPQLLELEVDTLRHEEAEVKLRSVTPQINRENLSEDGVVTVIVTQLLPHSRSPTGLVNVETSIPMDAGIYTERQEYSFSMNEIEKLEEHSVTNSQSGKTVVAKETCVKRQEYAREVPDILGLQDFQFDIVLTQVTSDVKVNEFIELSKNKEITLCETVVMIEDIAVTQPAATVETSVEAELEIVKECELLVIVHREEHIYNQTETMSDDEISTAVIQEGVTARCSEIVAVAATEPLALQIEDKVEKPDEIVQELQLMYGESKEEDILLLPIDYLENVETTAHIEMDSYQSYHAEEVSPLEISEVLLQPKKGLQLEEVNVVKRTVGKESTFSFVSAVNDDIFTFNEHDNDRNLENVTHKSVLLVVSEETGCVLLRPEQIIGEYDTEMAKTDFAEGTDIIETAIQEEIRPVQSHKVDRCHSMLIDKTSSTHKTSYPEYTVETANTAYTCPEIYERIIAVAPTEERLWKCGTVDNRELTMITTEDDSLSYHKICRMPHSATNVMEKKLKAAEITRESEHIVQYTQIINGSTQTQVTVTLPILTLGIIDTVDEADDECFETAALDFEDRDIKVPNITEETVESEATTFEIMLPINDDDSNGEVSNVKSIVYLIGDEIQLMQQDGFYLGSAQNVDKHIKMSAIRQESEQELDSVKLPEIRIVESPKISLTIDIVAVSTEDVQDNKCLSHPEVKDVEVGSDYRMVFYDTGENEMKVRTAMTDVQEATTIMSHVGLTERDVNSEPNAEIKNSAQHGKVIDTRQPEAYDKEFDIKDSKSPVSSPTCSLNEASSKRRLLKADDIETNETIKQPVEVMAIAMVSFSQTEHNTDLLVHRDVSVVRERTEVATDEMAEADTTELSQAGESLSHLQIYSFAQEMPALMMMDLNCTFFQDVQLPYGPVIIYSGVARAENEITLEDLSDSLLNEFLSAIYSSAVHASEAAEYTLIFTTEFLCDNVTGVFPVSVDSLLLHDQSSGNTKTETVDCTDRSSLLGSTTVEEQESQQNDNVDHPLFHLQSALEESHDRPSTECDTLTAMRFSEVSCTNCFPVSWISNEELCVTNVMAGSSLLAAVTTDQEAECLPDSYTVAYGVGGQMFSFWDKTFDLPAISENREVDRQSNSNEDIMQLRTLLVPLHDGSLAVTVRSVSVLEVNHTEVEAPPRSEEVDHSFEGYVTICEKNKLNEMDLEKLQASKEIIPATTMGDGQIPETSESVCSVEDVLIDMPLNKDDLSWRVLRAGLFADNTSKPDSLLGDPEHEICPSTDLFQWKHEKPVETEIVNDIDSVETCVSSKSSVITRKLQMIGAGGTVVERVKSEEVPLSCRPTFLTPYFFGADLPSPPDFSPQSEDRQSSASTIKVYTDTMEGEPWTERRVAEIQQTQPNGVAVTRRVVRVRKRRTIIKYIIIEGPEFEEEEVILSETEKATLTEAFNVEEMFETFVDEHNSVSREECKLTYQDGELTADNVHRVDNSCIMSSALHSLPESLELRHTHDSSMLGYGGESDTGENVLMESASSCGDFATGTFALRQIMPFHARIFLVVCVPRILMSQSS